MNLHMTPEQFEAIQARIKESARKVRGKASAHEPAVEKPPKIPVFIKPKKKDYGYESRLAAQLERRGITGFQREYRWLKDRKYRADIAFPEKRLLVEIDGAAHRIKGRFAADILKRQQAMLNGWRMLPIATQQVRADVAAAIVIKALET